MSALTFFVFFAQACLIQNAYSSCLGRTGIAAAPLGISDIGGCGTYGGVGVGNIRVAGELPVVGTTVVAGRIPIVGAVEFGGPACAGGLVTIAGTCTPVCGCGGFYY